MKDDTSYLVEKAFKAHNDVECYAKALQKAIEIALISSVSEERIKQILINNNLIPQAAYPVENVNS